MTRSYVQYKLLSAGILAVSFLMVFVYLEPSNAYGVSNTGIIVPLYSYPDSSWNTLAKEKTDHPSVPIIAIINPDNGPGIKDTNYVYGIKKLQSSGIKVIGYVYTANVGYGSITKYIDEYKSWYNLDGIFFDQMSHALGNETYYAKLSNYSKSVGLNFTVGNPGTDTLPSYVGTVDNMVLSDTAFLPVAENFMGWHKNFTKSNFSFISYDVPNVNQTYIGKMSKLVQYLYVTNYTLPNPFHSIPMYLGDVINWLDTNNAPSNTSLKVNTYTDKGVSLTGFWTLIKSGKNSSSAFTPFSLSVIPGNNYTVTMSNFGNYTFDHWDDGTKNNSRTIAPTHNMTISAYYVLGKSMPENKTSVTPINSANTTCNCTPKPILLNTGSVTASISYITGDRAYNYGVSLKIYQDAEQSVYRNLDSIASNPFEIDALPLGHSYKFVVYANGMQSDVQYLRLDTSDQKLVLHLRSPGGMRPNVFYNDGITPVHNAIVYVRDQQNNTWGMDYTDIHGQTLRFWLEPTIVNNDHYTMDVRIGQHMLYSYWPVFLYPGISRDITVVTPWPALVDSLVTVKSYDEQSKLLSAKNGSFSVVLADTNGNVLYQSAINYHGEANFSNLKVGDYTLSLVDVNGTRKAESKITIDGTKTNFALYENSLSHIGSAQVK